VDRNLDLLPLARDAGTRAIWFGIEDMTAALIKKGQTPEKTRRIFAALLDHGIAPMPMLMHHDGQPLKSRRGLAGLVNQVRYLRRAGAVSVQITFLTPMVGSKGYERNYRDRLVMQRVGGCPVEDYQYDGNHSIATTDPRPLGKQLNVLRGYAAFYNPASIARALVTFDDLWWFRLMYRTLGAIGTFRSFWAGRDWLRRLGGGRIERHEAPPAPKYRLVPAASVDPSLVHASS